MVYILNIFEPMADTQVTPKTSFDHGPVYMIHSNSSLGQLDKFLGKYGDVGFLRIVYDTNGKETDRTIAILRPEVYESLSTLGYDKRYINGMKITPYRLNASHFPGEGHTKNLFVPVPKTLNLNAGQVMQIVTDKLSHLTDWGIIPQPTKLQSDVGHVPINNWNIAIPVESRELGNIRNGCFISFNDNVTLEQIALARIIMNDTYWNQTGQETDRQIFRCTWARDRAKSNTPKTTTKVSEESSVPVMNQDKKEAPKRLLKKQGTYQKKGMKTDGVPEVVQPTMKDEEAKN